MRNEKGLTLIEILAAITILGILIVAFLNLSNFTMISSHRMDQKTEATRIAYEKLNMAREYITLHGTVPAVPVVAGFQIKYDIKALSSPSPTYDMTGLSSKHVSLQAVVLQTQVPYLLTCIVSWE